MFSVTTGYLSFIHTHSLKITLDAFNLRREMEVLWRHASHQKSWTYYPCWKNELFSLSYLRGTLYIIQRGMERKTASGPCEAPDFGRPPHESTLKLDFKLLMPQVLDKPMRELGGTQPCLASRRERAALRFLAKMGESAGREPTETLL